MKRAVFIDRDGTLIEEVGYLKMIEDLRFTHRAVQALTIFRELGFLTIVITNQSAVARGLLSPKELKRIHQKMKALAKEEGGVIDDVLYCPHFPEGRITPFNVDCDCRKPRPGLIYRAREKHRLDLAECFMVGDKVSDLELASNAGIKPVLVLTGYGTQTKSQWTGEMEVFENLYEFARHLESVMRPAVSMPAEGKDE